MQDKGHSQNWVKELLVGYACLIQWIVLSAAVIIFNKYILDTYKFGYPITLTMIHMGFSATLAFVLVQSRVVAPINITRALYFRAVVPIGVLYAMVLALSNATYMHLSVSFIQMLKAITPASVYLVAVFMGTEKWSVKMLVNMLVVVFGVAISAHGELNFVLFGVLLQLAAILIESFRLTMVQVLLQGNGIKFNPITTLYYVAPCCFVCLVPLYMFFEHSTLVNDATVQVTPFLLITNAATAFALNCAIFLLLGKTSALTMNLGGVVKDWVLIGLSVAIFGNPVTPINLLGYSIAFAGVSWYNYAKIKEKQAEAQMVTPKDVEGEQLLPSGKASGTPKRGQQQ